MSNRDAFPMSAIAFRAVSYDLRVVSSDIGLGCCARDDRSATAGTHQAQPGLLPNPVGEKARILDHQILVFERVNPVLFQVLFQVSHRQVPALLKA